MVFYTLKVKFLNGIVLGIIVWTEQRDKQINRYTDNAVVMLPFKVYILLYYYCCCYYYYYYYYYYY